MTEAVSEAQRMIDTFVSVGANKIHVTKTDINSDVTWGKAYSLEDLRKLLPAIIHFAEKQEECNLLDKKTGDIVGQVRAGRNLMVRPMSDTTAFIQLDDLIEAKLDRVRPVAFLTVRTSPGNCQAWLAVPSFASDQERKDFARRVKKQVSADSSATGSVRLAGTSNFKAKYAGNFPKVAIIDAAPGRMTTPEVLESLGLVAPADPEPVVIPFKSSHRQSQLGMKRSWPDYERCVNAAPLAKDGDGPDRSKADYFWCKMAAQRGWSIEETAEKLLEVSPKAQERARLHDEGYARVTAENAAVAAVRGQQRGRG